MYIGKRGRRGGGKGVREDEEDEEDDDEEDEEARDGDAVAASVFTSAFATASASTSV